MAEVLSQSQIDALLNSMQDPAGAEESEPQEKKKEEYKKYDFYSPKKFTKDKLKMMQGIYENYCRLVSSRLNAMLRVNSEIEVLGVEEQRYYEFSNGLSESDIIMLADLKLPNDSSNPPIITHINQILMVNMIDRMLGGLGDDTSIDSMYMYTDIELELYKRVMEFIIGATGDAWGNYIKLKVVSERLEENPSLFQEVSLDEPVAIVMLKVRMNKLEGILSVCIPGSLLTNVFSIIDKRKNLHADSAKDADRARTAILSKIKDSALVVRAELGDAQVSLRDVYGLKEGDVLDLNKPHDTEVSLYIDEEPWFTADPGIHKRNVAVKINNRIDVEEARKNADADMQAVLDQQEELKANDSVDELVSEGDIASEMTVELEDGSKPELIPEDDFMASINANQEMENI